MLEANVLPTLLSMVDTDINDIVRIKALYAVSCKYRSVNLNLSVILVMTVNLFSIGLIRDNDAGLKEFADKDGYSVLLRALQSDIEKLNIKSAFLLSSLCNQKPHIKGMYTLINFILIRVNWLQSNFFQFCR